MEMFERVYASGERHRTSRESYMLNIVFAIGAGIILGSSDTEDSPTSDPGRSPTKSRSSPPSHKKRRLAGQQHQPEEYHASAIVHLENFLGSTPAADRPDGFGGGLEELQAVLLLAGFALLRPVAPGLWYIVGVAVRLGVDLGLHYEDGVGIDGSGSEDHTTGRPEPKAEGNGTTTAADNGGPLKIDAKERGRRQWVRDLRRRLWWCVYSLDRLVSTCVGRPFVSVFAILLHQILLDAQVPCLLRRHCRGKLTTQCSSIAHDSSVVLPRICSRRIARGGLIGRRRSTTNECGLGLTARRASQIR
jgi:hypothetical protein